MSRSESRRPGAKEPAAKVRAAKKSTKKTAEEKVTEERMAALPKALADRAKASHAAKQARLLSRGRSAISRIRECQVDVAANMVDIGLALVELRAEGVVEALGRGSFAEVCEVDLRMAVSTANVLISLATKVPREVVTSLGTDRARAVLELCEATPEDESIEDLLSSTLALPSGRSLGVAEASTQELRDAAKELRDARAEAAGKRSRGLTTTPAEKKVFAALSKRLSASGHEGAKLVAGRGGKGAKVRFEVPLADVSAFAEALRAAAKG